MTGFQAEKIAKLQPKMQPCSISSSAQLFFTTSSLRAGNGGPLILPDLYCSWFFTLLTDGDSDLAAFRQSVLQDSPPLWLLVKKFFSRIFFMCFTKFS